MPASINASLLVLRRIQMVQDYRTRHARPTGPRLARPEDKPCAGHPRKPAGFVPQVVDGRDAPGHDGLSESCVCV